MNNKQSSVEKLAELIRFTNKEVYAELFEEIEQIKAMHQEEIEDAYWEGGQDVPVNGQQCQRYYNETFGGKQ